MPHSRVPSDGSDAEGHRKAGPAPQIHSPGADSGEKKKEISGLHQPEIVRLGAGVLAWWPMNGSSDSLAKFVEKVHGPFALQVASSVAGGTRLDHQYSETGTPVPDAASLSGADAGSDQDQGRDDRELARPAAPAAGTDPWPRRPWALTLFAVVVVLGVSALVGWQTQWPGTIFGARNAAAVTSASPSTAPPAPAQPSGQPGSFAPSSGAAGLSQVPGSAAASANADDPASVVDAYFAAINAQLHQHVQA